MHFSGRISKLYANFLGELLYYFISCSLFVYKVTSSIMFYSITACLSPCYLRAVNVLPDIAGVVLVAPDVAIEGITSYFCSL